MDIVLGHIQIWKSPCTSLAGTCWSRDHDVMGETFFLAEPIKSGQFLPQNLFLSIFGLLTFKECITWPRYKGWICFSRKTYRIMYHWKDNVMLINICNRIYSWFLSILRLLTFKEWDTWPWCKGEFVSLAKTCLFDTIGKRILCWSIIAIEPIADFNLFLS